MQPSNEHYTVQLLISVPKKKSLAVFQPYSLNNITRKVISTHATTNLLLLQGSNMQFSYKDRLNATKESISDLVSQLVRSL